MTFVQQLLDGKGNVADPTASVVNNPCKSGFNACAFSNTGQSLNSGPLNLAANTPYTFQASFSDAVVPYRVN